MVVLKTYRQCRRLRRMLVTPSFDFGFLKTYRQCRRLRHKAISLEPTIEFWRPIANVGGWDSHPLHPLYGVEFWRPIANVGGWDFLCIHTNAIIDSEDLSPMSAVETELEYISNSSFILKTYRQCRRLRLRLFLVIFKSFWRPIANVGGWDNCFKYGSPPHFSEDLSPMSAVETVFTFGYLTF